MLYVVATPIGNSDDITLRAIHTLKEVSYIFCEDTRVSQKLLTKLGIKTELISLHEFSGKNVYDKALHIMQRGDKIAYISDAGTPGVSDPGSKLVKLAQKEGFKVTPIPGPSALTTFLSVSGIDSTSFYFHGFFPRENKELEEVLEKIKLIDTIHIFYESPQRILKALDALEKVFSNSEILIGRELTKIHEEIFSGNFNEVRSKLDKFEGDVKGEFVFAIRNEKSTDKKIDFEEIEKEILRLKNEGYKTKEISSMIALKFSISQKEIYDLIVKKK